MTWQPAAVLYPDVEMWAIGSPNGYLRTALAARTESYATGVYLGNKVPATRLDRMLIARRDGGSEGEMRDRARLSLQVWAKTEADATNLALLVAALMRLAPNGSPVLQVTHQSGPTPIADTSGQPLRYLVYDVHLKGVAFA